MSFEIELPRNHYNYVGPLVHIKRREKGIQEKCFGAALKLKEFKVILFYKVKIWSTPIESNKRTEHDGTESEQIIRLTAPIIDDVIAINEDTEENTPPPSENKNSAKDSETKKTRELNKKDLKVGSP